MQFSYRRAKQSGSLQCEAVLRLCVLRCVVCAFIACAADPGRVDWAVTDA